MKLFIFDIDGTLARTNSVDSNCYKEAVVSFLGDVRFRDTWSDYVNVTDEGILSEIVSDNKIGINKEIKDSIKEKFLKLLKMEFNREKPEEIPGGIAFLQNLSRLNIAFSFATGCWKDSALLKLKETGYSFNPGLVASSDDSIERKQIMLISFEKAKNYYKLKDIEKIYYFGDGIHDFKACEKLDWNFIGVGEKVKELCKFNRCKWLYNYLDDSVIKELF